MLNRLSRNLGALLAASLWAVSAPTLAALPDNVSTTLEGCRNDGTPPISFPPGGPFVCPDAAYTSGNLGKGWNELDLVPYRITMQAGNSAPASQTYTVAVTLDYRDAGRPGYDVLSTLTKNVALSSPSCPNPVVGAQLIAEPGIGGTDASMYRLVSITQPKNTTCVYDYYGRLALGSHLYPGASLHANMMNENLGVQGIGARDVSIPVKEILPQSLRKDMLASADSDVVWNLLKSANPASINFGDVCAAPEGPLTQQVTFRVEWVKVGVTPLGVTVLTNVYAKNPAHRTITVDVTDRIYKGTTQAVLLDTASSGPVDVAANTEVLVLTHQKTLDPSAGALGDFLNDVATATYTDKDTGIAVPGNTTATASAQIGAGTVTNSSAAIADSEQMTPPSTGLTFAVAQPALGAFQGGYVAGTQTAGPVDWALGGQTSSGFVDFVKTIRLDAHRVTSGVLTDTAVLVAAPGGATKVAGPIDVGITSSASVALTVTKHIPPILMGANQRIEVTFRITRGGDAFQEDRTLVFGSLETQKSVSLAGLAPGVYTVTELSSRFFDGAVYGPSNLVIDGSSQAVVDLTAGADGVFSPAECAGTASFRNIPAGGPTLAQVQKITDPAIADNPADPNYADLEWLFTLNGPGGPVQKTVKAGQGFGEFPLVLQEGNYTVVETTKTGWQLTNAAPDANGDKVCEFTVDYPADFGKTFSCTFYNQKQGKARVVKTVLGAPPSGTQAFAFQLRQGASTTQIGTTLESLIANAANGGTLSFATQLKPGNTYQMCEVVMPGWTTTLGSFVPDSFVPPDGVAPNPNVDNSILCANFTVAAGETKTFTVDNAPPPGGRALTIGFWKNWASCSGGKQKPVLDQTLAAAPVIGDGTDGHATLPGIVVSATSGTFPQFGPTFYEVLHGSTATPNVAPDCVQAVRLLNKSTVDTARKMASDPAFNMAAQLVAAQLNYTAGAGKTPAATTAINQAVLLLGKVKFNGKTHTAISAADATTMNNLAKLLDDYNNNR